MTGVMLSQSVILVLLLTVHGHVRSIGRSGCHGWRIPVAHRLTRGLYVSLGQGGSKLRGSSAFDDAARARARRRNVAPRCSSRPKPLRKARVGWSLSFVL
jgi:hypothetical protein